MSLIVDTLLAEGRRDRHRPWWSRTTGGVLVGIVLAVLVGSVLVDLLAG